VSDNFTALVAEKAKVLMGQSPPSSACSENGDGLPFIQGNAEFGQRIPSPRLRCSAPTRIAEAGDLLLSVRAPVGELNQSIERIVIGRGLSALRFEPVEQRFAWHAVKFAAPALNRVAQGSTFVAVSREDVERLQIPWHDEANLRIAAVLDTVDRSIARTEAVIAKLRQVRAGLLHDLLTRGLGAHGQLRDPIAHPEQFQPSPLGQIPKEWDVRKLKECYEIPSRNGLYKKASFYGFGHRMIHMPQMFKGISIDVEDAVRVDVDPQELQRYALEEGDILFARRSLNLEGAGLCSMVGTLREPATFESSIVRVRVKRDIIVPRFAVEFLRSPAGYLLRRRFIRQVAVSGVSSDDISHFLVPCPKPHEQECILSLLDAKDSVIRLVEDGAAKLLQLKSGLMNDLLTGRVRVPESIGVNV
jgi:type I restriction enzyme S subunit